MGEASAVAGVAPLPPWLSRWLRLRDHLAADAMGGARPFTAAQVINLQKGGTLPLVLLLMWWHDAWGATAWTYAALHGSYGVIWLLKDRIFPDPAWAHRVTLGGAALMFGCVLGPYWIAPWIVTAHHVAQPAWVLGVAGLAYAVGVVMMTGADAQKYFTRRLQPGLISTGWYARMRHPNYAGEMLVYGSFALLAGHWLPWAVLAVVWGAVFLPNMWRTEARLARHAEWPAYRARTGFLLPRVGGRRYAATGSRRAVKWRSTGGSSTMR